jgi:hypothetical protein
MKAGKYYIVDPCYLWSGSDWDKVLEDTDYFNKNGMHEVFGEKCIVVGTQYGDGEYYDDEGNRYMVDAGIMGVMPEVLVNENMRNFIDKDKIGKSFYFKNDVSVEYIDYQLIVGDGEKLVTIDLS